ncbi:hypothetical protein M422DRAFT_29614 [Sphaerobolus stellatus SS14]|uniref:Glutathione transferase n=1 Tax=Sphaerobolus stellatus (strain SS14) TaxID=990650 RepID=A0A0C9URH3_SPHS4|nr:hypothetical protein M422DRAFT_29614 [Sphaerobolus stellatus SS14]
MSSYTLLYWPGIPGRGEYVRLAFEYTNTKYKEINVPNAFSPHLSPKGPHFAVPILQIDNGWTLSQTAAILAYLAPKLKLAGANEHEQATINQLTLTALDLSTEAHDVHHPVANALYYEDQKDEALRAAEDFKSLRIPKYLTHFETVLKGNAENNVLVGSAISTADLTLFQVLEGLLFAFPRRMGTMKKSGQYDKTFALHETVKNLKNLQHYLKSDRRNEFSMGLFRHYPELDSE